MRKPIFGNVLWLLVLGGICIYPAMAEMLYLALPAYAHRDGRGWWRPQPGVSWQWQLSGKIDTSIKAEMYDIDLFETKQPVIDELHHLGRRVICYFSAGSWESYRPDSDAFPQRVLGKTLDGWPDERWLDIRELEAIAPIMGRRLDLAVEKGCDGVEPDNVDGFSNDSGFAIDAEDQLRFNKWLAREAHSRGLSIGLKNDLQQISQLVTYFDWALNEQCFEYDECALLLPFIDNNKAVFGVEYNLVTGDFCAQANSSNFDWLKKRLELDSWRLSCR